MKLFIYLLFFFMMPFSLNEVLAQGNLQTTNNDTITLAQAYMNLYLTETYFDTLSKERISKILAFEENELSKINDKSFIEKNHSLYQFTNSLYFLNRSKLLSQQREVYNRSGLRRLKSIFDESIQAYNSAKIDEYQTFANGKNNLYEIISFDQVSNYRLLFEIRKLKDQFNRLFNEDIYPDFKRIFKRSSSPEKTDIDSLTYFARIYDMPLSTAILRNKAELDVFPFQSSTFITPEYTIDSKLDLISRYLQLKYLASPKVQVPRNFNKTILYEAYDDFLELKLETIGDQFIREELNPRVCAILLDEIERKFPRDKNVKELVHPSAPGIMMEISGGNYKQYFFPNPAPLASADSIINQFKPSLNTLNQVDRSLMSVFTTAGYKNQVHYYYDMDGFALTTSLEKFNLNGTAVSSSNRFIKNLGGNGKFSYYEIFKSMFFDVESEYRMFAFIIASQSATMSNEAMTAGFAEEILQNSYDRLPAELRNVSLPTKVLSIFVYHFHQNDIGEVPELDLSGKLSVQDHLKNAGLSKIID
ncbi:hypothetical protein [Algoriphagus chordae]|nr:hypothetical protein [Algoriphagus chordae]